MLPLFAAIALFVMLVLLWLGERVADRDPWRSGSSTKRLPPGPPQKKRLPPGPPRP